MHDTVPQLTRELLARMSPEAINQARERGHLDELLGREPRPAMPAEGESLSLAAFLALDIDGRMAAIRQGRFDVASYTTEPARTEGE